MKFSITRRVRRGSSIVELLLIVIVVMAVTFLCWKIGSGTIQTANRSKVIREITKFNEAFDNFCMRFGELPPDFHDQTATIKYLKRIFSKCPPKNYPDLSCQSPASALYFWLAGPKGLGFSANPVNPFETKGTVRIGPFFKFDTDRVHEVDRAMQYFPIRRGEDGEPYVYFRGGPKGYNNHPGWNSVQPYRNSNTGKWINPDTFQLLCAGGDGKFGSGRLYPRGSDYDEYNYEPEFRLRNPYWLWRAQKSILSTCCSRQGSQNGEDTHGFYGTVLRRGRLLSRFRTSLASTTYSGTPTTEIATFAQRTHDHRHRISRLRLPRLQTFLHHVAPSA